MTGMNAADFVATRQVGTATVTCISDGAGLSNILKLLPVPEAEWRREVDADAEGTHRVDRRERVGGGAEARDIARPVRKRADEDGAVRDGLVAGDGDGAGESARRRDLHHGCGRGSGSSARIYKGLPKRGRRLSMPVAAYPREVLTRPPAAFDGARRDRRRHRCTAAAFVGTPRRARPWTNDGEHRSQIPRPRRHLGMTREPPSGIIGGQAIRPPSRRKARAQ